MAKRINRNALHPPPLLGRSLHHPLGIALALAVAALPWNAAFATQIIPIGKVDFKSTSFNDKPGLRVIVSAPMVLKQGGAFGLMGYTYELESGTYRDFRTYVIEGREIAVLPVRELLHGETPRGGGSMGSLGACYQPDGKFIAIDINSGDVLQRSLLRNLVASSCGGGAKIGWSSTVSSIKNAGDVKIVWGQEWLDMDRRQTEDKQRVAGLEALAERYRDDGSRAAKTKIGARVCQEERGVRYVGFTEGISPDNGKIQIRVTNARYAAHPSVSPGGFQPSIIWANPDDWESCE